MPAYRPVALPISSADGTTLTTDAANALALRNGTNAQTFNVYNTYTDASNYERLAVTWVANQAYIIAEQSGTGQNRPLTLRGSSVTLGIGNSARWQVDTSGNFVASTDNASDIGASGANRPRVIYSAGNIISGNDVLAAANARFQLSGRSGIGSTTDGNLALTGNAGNFFNLLQFGGTTSSFPAIKRSATQLQVRLADDSADAPLTVSYVKTQAVTVAGLPAAATAGISARSFVTDALAPTFGAAVTGGGAVKIPVYSDGTTWLVG